MGWRLAAGLPVWLGGAINPHTWQAGWAKGHPVFVIAESQQTSTISLSMSLDRNQSDKETDQRGAAWGVTVSPVGCPLARFNRQAVVSMLQYMSNR